MSETPLPNSPDARTVTGEIKDPNQPTETTTTRTETETTQPSTTGDAVKPSEAGKDDKGNPKSLLDDGKKVDETNEYHGAPEKYEEWKVPEGYELDKDTATAAGDMFRKLGLSQKAGQELVDFYNKHLEQQINERVNAYQDLRKQWRTETTNDPEVGGRNLDQVKVAISRVLDSYPDQRVVGDFKEKMNLTGAGDIASFVKIFNWMAQRLGEGGFVKGVNPAGQSRDGGIRPTLAKAMFPNLPSTSG